MAMHIKTTEQKLTNGSSVFDVVLSENGSFVCGFACKSQEAANAFAEGLQGLIDEHTTDIATRS
jgi:hypothetical protein